MKNSKKNSKAKFPHEGLLTQLLASGVAPGKVGVFAILPMKTGVDAFPGDKSKLTCVSEKEIRALKLPETIYLNFYEFYGVLVGDKRYAPENFSCLGNSWHVKHSKKPNLEYVDDERGWFRTKRKINAGEELTVDFDEIG